MGVHIRHSLHEERVAVLGDKRLAHGMWAVEITLGDSAVLERLRREERLRVSMLLNKALRDDPEDLCPDLTNSMLADQ